MSGRFAGLFALFAVSLLGLCFLSVTSAAADPSAPASSASPVESSSPAPSATGGSTASSSSPSPVSASAATGSPVPVLVTLDLEHDPVVQLVVVSCVLVSGLVLFRVVSSL